MDQAVSKAPAEQTPGSAVLALVLAGVGPFILASAVTLCCYFASGMTLGLFFGPMLLLTFLTPPLAMSVDTLPCRLLVCAGLFFGVWLVWIVAFLTSGPSILEILGCGCVLAAYVIALGGGAAVLERLRMGPVLAAALTVLLGIAWLTWPLWLIPWLTNANSQAIVQRMTVAHPLMALNGVLFDRFNSWDRFTITYQQLTTLNQDIFYMLPRSVALMVTTHGILGIGGMMLGEVMRRKSNHV